LIDDPCSAALLAFLFLLDVCCCTSHRSRKPTWRHTKGSSIGASDSSEPLVSFVAAKIALISAAVLASLDSKCNLCKPLQYFKEAERQFRLLSGFQRRHGSFECKCCVNIVNPRGCHDQRANRGGVASLNFTGVNPTEIAHCVPAQLKQYIIKIEIFSSTACASSLIT
jgi:hypothetical protein